MRDRRAEGALFARKKVACPLLSPDEGYRLSHEMAQKALEIDPDYAPAEDALGWIALTYELDLATAARRYERALALEPANPEIIISAAVLLDHLGRVDKAIELAEHVVARDPVDVTGHFNLGISYLNAALWEEAYDSFRTAVRLSPGTLGAHFGVGTS